MGRSDQEPKFLPTLFGLAGSDQKDMSHLAWDLEL